MISRDDVAGYVLAGGRSRRMGQDKALLVFRGKTLIERALGLMRDVAGEVAIIGNRADLAQHAAVFPDATADFGPVAGLVSGLKRCGREWCVFVPVDLPLLSPELLRQMLEVAEREQALCVVPTVDDVAEPLCVVLHRTLHDSLNQQMVAREQKVMRALEAAAGTRLFKHAVEGKEQFANLNTPEEFEKLRAESSEAIEKAPMVVTGEPPVEQPLLNGLPGDDVPKRETPFIAFEHVSKSFGSLNVLDDVSFFVMPGETLCILGRSGVGKSVSLQIIMGFLKVDSGRVLMAEEDVTSFTEEQLQRLRKKVTMVFQNGALFDSLTVGENVAFPLRERHELVEDQIQQVVNGLLEMVGVAGMANLLPSDLSTGMKRSVAIARALGSQPEGILYDEPTTMVDPLMGRLLGNLIQKLKQQLSLTSIVVTHDMRFAERLADRIVFLHQAKAHFFGTLAEFQASQDPIIRQFLDLDALVLPTFPGEPPRDGGPRPGAPL